MNAAPIFLAFAFLLSRICLVLAVPYKPASDDVVIEKLPRSVLDARSYQAARSKLHSNPTNLSVALPLARGYLEIAQRTSDPAFVDYAEGVIQPLVAQGLASPEIFYLRGVLRQHKHDFANALADLDRVLASEPSHFGALLGKASILMTQGRYKEAKKIFLGNLPLTRNLGGLTVFCTLASMNGSLETSYGLLFGQAAVAHNVSPEEQAFAWTALGEMGVRQGKLELAEAHFKKALALQPDSSYSLATYCDLLLSLGRAGEVLNRIEENTPSEALLLRRILARKENGDPDVVDQAIRAARIFHQSGHLRELAFLQLEVLEQRQEALEAALRNWEAQKEPIDALIALKAAAAGRNPASVQSILDWVRESKLEDVRLDAVAARLANPHCSANREMNNFCVRRPPSR
ncbi:MAG TPA: tetratricopeptide repeat protein [Verrucomicrobiae bacterium]|nr:tetratricopeptide repeat protein [Verrucomicrobiae bacterium]